MSSLRRIVSGASHVVVSSSRKLSLQSTIPAQPKQRDFVVSRRTIIATTSGTTSGRVRSLRRSSTVCAFQRRNHRHSILSCPWWNAVALVVSVPATVTASNDHAETSTTTTTTVVVHSSSTNDDLSLAQRIIRWIKEKYESLKELIYITIRGSQIILYISPLALLVPSEYLYSTFLQSYVHNNTSIASSSSKNNNYKANTPISWSYLRWSITHLGPAFCKLAQWMATRRDLFPRALCDELSQLQDRGISHLEIFTKIACEHEFGQDIWEHLHVNEMIGCGSAAQVYKGVYKDQKVAIKVLHPDLYTRMEADLHLARAFANVLHSFVPMLNLPQAVANFGSSLLAQADLRLEAENLSVFHENFGKESFVRVPRPIVFGETVLIEELMEDARPMTEYIAQHQYENSSMSDQQNTPQIRKELAGPLLRAFLKMIFLDNFVHCDLHSGNILVQELSADDRSLDSAWDRAGAWLLDQWNGTTHKEEHLRIILLDAGIVVRLQANDLRNLRDLFKAVILNDGATAGTLMVERSRDPSRCTNVPMFSKKLQALVEEFHDNRKAGLTLGAVRIGNLLTRVLDLCHEHHVEIDPNMASIVVSTLVLEGLGRSLDPDLNLIDFAIPFVLGRGRM